MKACMQQGRRPELVGGGLVRSVGGWAELKKLRSHGMDRVKGDQRILGDTSFVLSILNQADQLLERGLSLKLYGIDLESVAKKAAEIFGIEPYEIFIKSRIKPRADARALYCYWAVNELGISLSELAARLEMTPAGIGYARQRGERIVQMNGYDLLI